MPDWDEKDWHGLGGTHRQKIKPPKPPPPLAVGSWFRFVYDDEDNTEWGRVIENFPGRVLLELRSGGRLTVDRKLVLSTEAKRSSRRSGV